MGLVSITERVWWSLRAVLWSVTYIVILRVTRVQFSGRGAGSKGVSSDLTAYTAYTNRFATDKQQREIACMNHVLSSMSTNQTAHQQVDKAFAVYCGPDNAVMLTSEAQFILKDLCTQENSTHWSLLEAPWPRAAMNFC